jgi:hypothetical protein
MTFRTLASVIVLACAVTLASLWWGTLTPAPDAEGAPERGSSEQSGLQTTAKAELVVDPVVRQPEAEATPEPAPAEPATPPTARSQSNEALITELLTKVRQNISDPDEKQAVISTLLFQSIATILDQQGRYQLLRTDGSSPFQSGDGSMVLMANGRQYNIEKGEFPEYEAFLATEKEKQAWYKEMAKGTTHAPMPTLSEETIQAIEMRAAQALSK